jgi:hypothetical protein
LSRKKRTMGWRERNNETKKKRWWRVWHKWRKWKAKGENKEELQNQFDSSIDEVGWKVDRI